MIIYFDVQAGILLNFYQAIERAEENMATTFMSTVSVNQHTYRDTKNAGER